jgi:hypothetical protein
MAKGQLTRLLAVLAAGGAIALPVAGCGDDSKADQGEAQDIQAREEAKRDKIERMIQAGKLPPVALRLVNLNGTTNVNFIDGPNNDRDIVRSSPDGTSGKKLVFDLNQDGKIEKAERNITERDLYDATLGLE